MTWIQTYDGQKFDFANPSPDAISIETIAICLSRIQRFGGHLSQPYTVAEHSMRVAGLCPEKYALEGLLHDASEAYIGDIVRPLKLMLPEIKEIEQRIVDAIWKKFDLDGSEEAWATVKRWDNAALAHEAWLLFDEPPIDNWHENYEYLPGDIIPVGDSDKINAMFIRRYKRLKRHRELGHATAR